MTENRERLKDRIRENLRGSVVSLLISVCLAGVILASIFVLRQLSDKTVGAKACPTDNIADALNLIAPTQLGIAQWQIGDYATYQYSSKLTTPLAIIKKHFGPDGIKSRLSSRDVKFHIIAELNTSGEKRHWLRVTGLDFYRRIPKALYRLVMPNDLRITPEAPMFNFVKDYIPIRTMNCNQASTPLATLVKLDEVALQTPAGRFDCVRYRVEFSTDATPIEIWANSKILPLGIVRVSTPKEVLELTAYGQDTDIQIPELIQPVIEGISTLKKGCSSCHGTPCHEFISPPF